MNTNEFDTASLLLGLSLDLQQPRITRTSTSTILNSDENAEKASWPSHSNRLSPNQQAEATVKIACSVGQSLPAVRSMPANITVGGHYLFSLYFFKCPFAMPLEMVLLYQLYL